jgi:predicted O-linked N-acetylglucosamine transferase (SPINDLY family)
LECAFDKFVEASELNDFEIASKIRKDEIDLLIDLNGLSGGSRPGIFAFRPAPIQISYLGYPGTMGVPYIDYLIADEYIIRPADQVHYTERIVYLPGTYQANDCNRPIADQAFARSALGLPDRGFVFCCFNNSFKITPAVFDTWMRILRQVNESVLWLLNTNLYATANLQREATKRGINAERLIFADRLPIAEHLARHRAADLFLDTTPCNAHTTASDALWAGVPIVTQIGETFAGRVAASLLMAIGLPELITETPRAYEALAIDLATRPDNQADIVDSNSASPNRA